jgi:hypothetical protein
MSWHAPAPTSCSPLEFSKLTLTNFAHHSRHIPRPNLILPHRPVKPQASTKYLGVILDQHLNWAPQRAYVTEKGANWTLQIKLIARPEWGVTPKYARRLYIGVVLPKILYRAEVWFHPTPAKKQAKYIGKRGMVVITKKLTSIQRAGALAITGGLWTSPTDIIDALANLIPFEQIIETWCYRAVIRCSTGCTRKNENRSL